MLVARDRFLKPGGAIFPTQATLSIAPISDKKLFDSLLHAADQFCSVLLLLKVTKKPTS